MTKEEKVNTFLADVRKRIENGQYDFIYDDMLKLTNLGISITEAINVVKNLKLEDYYRGPKKDHLYPEQEVYEFGKWLDAVELYIKLTIRKQDDLFIMSFHEAKRPINYPYK